MEEVIYYNDLYDIYNSLLTEKQKSYFQDYYFDNLSYSEMAEKYSVSRNAVFKQLHIVLEKLQEYEDKLILLEIKHKVEDIANKVSDEEIKQELDNLFIN